MRGGDGSSGGVGKRGTCGGAGFKLGSGRAADKEESTSGVLQYEHD
jgi:hypothetical protein